MRRSVCNAGASNGGRSIRPFAFRYQGNGATPCQYIHTTRKAIDCATALPLTVFRRPFVKRFALCYQTVVCLSCLSVCNVRALWPNGWTDQDQTWHAGRPQPWPHCVRWRLKPHGKGQFWGRKVRTIIIWVHSELCEKWLNRSKIPFGLWTWMGARKHVLHGGAHYRYLANITEPSVFGGDAEYCQMTLSTCYT